MDNVEKIDDILKEIWCADEFKVKISKGKIVAVCKQTVSRPKHKGVDTEHRISEVIPVGGGD